MTAAMRDVVLVLLLAAPFVALGGLVGSLTALIGNRTRRAQG